MVACACGLNVANGKNDFEFDVSITTYVSYLGQKSLNVFGAYFCASQVDVASTGG